MNRLQDKVALVTGGARGIGTAQCKRMAEEGARVAVTDVLDDEGTPVAEEIRNNGGEAKYWHLDVSDEDNVKDVIADVVDTWGKLDVLVNNAGIAGVDKPTDEVTLDEWEKVQAINVRGVFLCTKHAIPAMRDAGCGSIINLSSIYGIIGAPDVPPYHASKGAVREMSKVDALLYADDKIRVNSVHPGFVWTPLVEDLAERKDMSVDEFVETTAAKHPLGRMGEPDDIAWGVVYLASDEARWLTGSELVIDGGYTAQ
ncbi:MAG: SDR family NAD(P)-dependent oxidoreductase [Planctomycetota bacterium]